MSRGEKGKRRERDWEGKEVGGREKDEERKKVGGTGQREGVSKEQQRQSLPGPGRRGRTWTSQTTPRTGGKGAKQGEGEGKAGEE